MYILNKINERYIVLCTKCKNELYFEAMAEKIYILKCINCNQYYEWNKKTEGLVVSLNYDKTLELLARRGFSDIESAKVKISDYLDKPLWIKILFKIFK